MRSFSTGLLALLTGSAVLSAATPSQPLPATQPPPAPQEAAPEPSIDALISALSSEDYQVRQKATLKLWSMGESVLEKLRVASEGEDPEVTFRTSKLIRDIEHFITPDTDPELIQYVENFRKANTENKVDIFRKIFIKRGWHQILKLYASEKDPEALEKLRDQAYDAAINGAREKIIAGKDDEALRFLLLAPRDARSLLSLACFHRANGSLEKERLNAAAGPADLQAALARAAGDTRAAANAATEAGDPQLAAAMGLFHGEFLPWLDLAEAVEENPSRKLYMEVIRGRWDPQKMEGAKNALARLTTDAATARDEEVRYGAAASLFLAGYPDLAEASLAKAPMLEAVDYYLSMERYDEALSAFGLDPASSDFHPWVEQKFEIYLNRKRFENDRAQDDASKAEQELVKLALLLNRLGLDAEMISAYEKPMLTMAESAPEDFLTLLSTLLSGRPGYADIVPLAEAVGAKWAGADEGRWRQLVNLAFNEDEIAIQWWEWTAVLDPQASLRERFKGLLGLFGSSSDPERARNRWLDLAWKATEKATPAQKSQYLKRISHPSEFSRTDGTFTDLATALRVQEMQAPDEQESVLQSQNFMGLSMRGDWDQVVDIFTKLIGGEKNDRVSLGRVVLHAYLAASLRRAGREKEATVQDEWVEKLTLGDSELSIRISNGYAFGGDMERAEIWLSRYAIEGSPTLTGYAELRTYAEDSFKNYPIQLLEKGLWKESAALSEALALRVSGIDVKPSDGPHLLQIRLMAELPHALSLLESDRTRALEMLGLCHSYFPGGGMLADYFFPALRKAGLIKEHDQYFESSWKMMSTLTERYPNSEQTLNGAAWLAARAARRLPEAEAMSQKALALNPDQAAYLDTFAEIHFAKKDRKGATKWSALAVNFNAGASMIRRQYERFSNDPFPTD